MKPLEEWEGDPEMTFDDYWEALQENDPGMTTFSDWKQWCELFYETGRGDGRLETPDGGCRTLLLGIGIGIAVTVIAGLLIIPII
jgi:hypothetical protein